jgi:hypothetical protein
MINKCGFYSAFLLDFFQKCPILVCPDKKGRFVEETYNNYGTYNTIAINNPYLSCDVLFVPKAGFIKIKSAKVIFCGPKTFISKEVKKHGVDIRRGDWVFPGVLREDLDDFKEKQMKMLPAYYINTESQDNIYNHLFDAARMRVNSEIYKIREKVF